ncbi:hypothetical protein Tco_1366452 [Tanacetum coccineum]
MLPTNTSYLDLLCSFTPDTTNSQFTLPNDDTFGTFDECNSQYSEDYGESKNDVKDDYDDGSEVAAQSHSQGVMDWRGIVDEKLYRPCTEHGRATLICYRSTLQLWKLKILIPL